MDIEALPATRSPRFAETAVFFDQASKQQKARPGKGAGFL
jgi:hypothetical protein